MATENYLLSVYRLEEQGERVTLTLLAEHLKTLPEGEGLGTSLPSVGGMIRRMTREGLLQTTANKDVVLTTKGLKSAESIVRRHRLAERLVVDLLGLELHKAHEEAHRLEHAISPDLETKIVSTLGNPKTCPFGAPIPGSDYEADKQTIPLSQAEPGRDVVIDRVPEDSRELLEYFVDNHLVPGEVVLVKEIAIPRGVITLVRQGQEVVFSYEVASKIRVRPS